MARASARRAPGHLSCCLAAVSARWLIAAAVLPAVGAVSCRSVGEYIWVDALEDPPPPRASYVIGRGDVVSVRVWNQESMSGRARVRDDGVISLPLVNDVRAAGLEPNVLASHLQAKLKEFVVSPVVTVSIDEVAPVEISVIGEVSRPGVYRLDFEATVLKALASAGGLAPFATRDRIFVLRNGMSSQTAMQPVRVRFTYEALAHAAGPAARFRLRSGDILVVE